MRIGIIGSGITGLSAAWALKDTHDVTLYESESRLGGHANTVDVDGLGGSWSGPVDTGFIVFNNRNYPNLLNFFKALDVESIDTSMDFSVSIEGGRLEYKGENILARPMNLTSPRFLRMAAEIPRFYYMGQQILNRGTTEFETLGEFLDHGGFGKGLTQDHLLPMLGAIWSCPAEKMRDFPLVSILRFMNNHGLLSFFQQPQWRTVKGGSREYVSRVAQSLVGRLRLNSPVVSARRTEQGVTLIDAKGHSDTFDQVVFACHSDQALKILGADASQSERDVLGGLTYAPNRAVLHTDKALMPKRKSAWASWNYLSKQFGKDDSPIAVSYWMNMLQKFESPEPIFVTLNPYDEPTPGTVLGEFAYDHPVFDKAAIGAQSQLASIQGVSRCWFGGAYAGNGFHEDGSQAGFTLAQALGGHVPWSADIVPVSSSVRLVDQGAIVRRWQSLADQKPVTVPSAADLAAAAA